MGCGSGFNDLFRPYGSGCNNRSYRTNDYQRDDIQEKIALIKRMYAEGKIDRDRYYSLKDRAYNGNVSFEELMDIKEVDRDYKIEQTGDKNTNKDSDANKYKEKIIKLKSSRDKVVRINEKIQERLHELIQEREKMEGIAESMVASSEKVAREFIEKKLDLEENIQTLEKRQKELNKEIEEIEKTIKVVETKILDYEAVKLQEELKSLKGDI